MAQCGVVMRGRGNKRPGFVAKCIFVLIVAFSIAAVVLGINRFRDEPPTVPGGRITPDRAAPLPGPSQQPALQLR